MADAMGGSYITWSMQHNIGHHPHCNRQGDYEDEDYDPDTRSGAPMVRLSPHNELKFHHQYQHLYFWVLLPFVAIKWMYTDLKHLTNGKFQNMDFWDISDNSVFMQYVAKSICIFYSAILPIYFHGIVWGIFLSCILFGVHSIIFSLLFVVNHLTETTVFPNKENTERDWAKLQVMTSSNFANDSYLWMWISGGLNFQIEHHLFPSIAHVNLPIIAPIVKQTCKQYDVPYASFPTYWSALASFYYHIKSMGSPVNDEKNKKQN